MRDSSRSVGSLFRVVLALLIVSATALLASAQHTAAAGQPPQLTAEDSSNAYFFPFDEGFSNTTTTSQTFLSVAANVTATVLNSSDAVVRTLLNKASESAGTFDPTWDGTKTGGGVVADGSYIIQIVASNSGGNATLTYQRQVASGTPGQLTTPTAGATLSGTAGFVLPRMPRSPTPSRSPK